MDNDLNSVGTHRNRNISARKYLLRVSPDAERVQKVPVDDFSNSYIQNGPNSAQAVIDSGFSNNPFLPSTPKEIIDSGDYNYNINILLGCNRYVYFDFFNPSLQLGVKYL